MTIPNSTAPSASTSGGTNGQIAFLQEVNRRRQSKPSLPLSTRLYRLWTIDGRVKEAERARSSVLDLLVRARDEGYMTLEEYKDCMLTVDLLVANQNKLEELTWWQKWAMIKIIVKENRTWKYKMLTRTETSCRNYTPNTENSAGSPHFQGVEPVPPGNRTRGPNIPLSSSEQLRILIETRDQPCDVVSYISYSTVSEHYRHTPVEYSYEATKKAQELYGYPSSRPGTAGDQSQAPGDGPVDAEKGAGLLQNPTPETVASMEATSSSSS